MKKISMALILCSLFITHIAHCPEKNKTKLREVTPFESGSPMITIRRKHTTLQTLRSGSSKSHPEGEQPRETTQKPSSDLWLEMLLSNIL